MFFINDGVIYREGSGKAPTKPVGKVNPDGTVTIETGNAKQRAALESWLKTQNLTVCAPGTGGTLGIGPAEASGEAPPWNPMTGMATPGLAEYIEAHGMDAAAVEKMVRKLERGEAYGR